MTIILTNDDGIDAPGIRALQQAVSESTTIVAPNQQYSGCGHQVTTYSGMKLEKRSPTEYALAGTPADCTRLAIKNIAPNTKLVLSGINPGGNLGTDVYVSGTVAAVI
ncbi:MAG: 5'/3'-nucleotidase SurE, partial [Cyanobacteria bacterium J06553_1]